VSLLWRLLLGAQYIIVLFLKVILSLNMHSENYAMILKLSLDETGNEKKYKLSTNTINGTKIKENFPRDRIEK
jgi:hypothetical protein